MPTRSYLPQGSLIDLVCYPRFASNEHKAALEVLGRVGLSHVVERWGLDESRDWKPLLSPGEQQRVGFARLLLQLSHVPEKSALAVLDEATSSVDVATEKHLYGELRKELEHGPRQGQKRTQPRAREP